MSWPFFFLTLWYSSQRLKNPKPKVVFLTLDKCTRLIFFLFDFFDCFFIPALFSTRIINPLYYCDTLGNSPAVQTNISTAVKADLSLWLAGCHTPEPSHASLLLWATVSQAGAHCASHGELWHTRERRPLLELLKLMPWTHELPRAVPVPVKNKILALLMWCAYLGTASNMTDFFC